MDLTSDVSKCERSTEVNDSAFINIFASPCISVRFVKLSNIAPALFPVLVPLVMITFFTASSLIPERDARLTSSTV